MDMTTNFEPFDTIALVFFSPLSFLLYMLRIQVPVRDSRLIELTWQLPFSPHADYASKPSSYLSHLLGHEGAGSVLSLLKAKGWANGLSAGQFASASDFAIFGCQVRREGVVAIIECIHSESGGGVFFSSTFALLCLNPD
jgi:secreted Zn-dependent insulinase-like peptidase